MSNAFSDKNIADQKAEARNQLRLGVGDRLWFSSAVMLRIIEALEGKIEAQQTAISELKQEKVDMSSYLNDETGEE